MKLEQQVCSLELAKRLKELGVKQESLFYWVDEDIIDHREIRFQADKDYLGVNSAFTVAELGDILPQNIITNKLVDETEDWYCQQYSENFSSKNSHNYQNILKASTEADARAKMLVYLLENKLIDFKEAA